MDRHSGRRRGHMTYPDDDASRAMLMILTSIDPADEAEFDLWYNREHLGERVAIPGFISARRYRGDDRAIWAHLALYETDSLDVFRSAPYRAALAAQSEWSRRMLPRFVNPQRNVVRLVDRVGSGFGASVSLLALRPTVSQTVFAESVVDKARRLFDDTPDLVSVSLWQSDPDLSRPVAEYAVVDTSPVAPGDWFVLLDWATPGRSALTDAAVAALLSEAPALRIGDYLFRNSLAATDLS
jgi:hypothetical protein